MIVLGNSCALPWKRIVMRNVPLRPDNVRLLIAVGLENVHERLTKTRRLDSVFTLPLRLVVMRTLPRQPAAALTPAGSVSLPRVVNR